MSEHSNVMLVGSNGETFDSNNVSFCVLPHPRYGPITFLKTKGKIYEIQKVQPRKFGSWFINQRVLSDCSYLMVSKFDIRFLILPFFENFGDKYRPLDQIIASVEGCDRIGLENCDDWNLSEICDINDKLGEDMILYRINMEKVLEWLRSKVTSAIEVISSQRRRKAADSLLAQTFNSSAQSNTTVSSPSQIDEGGNNEDTRTALVILADCLTESMSAKLVETYGMTTDAVLSVKGASSSGRLKSDWERALEVEKETLPYAAAHTSQGTHSGSNSAGDSTNKRKVPPSAPTSKSLKMAKSSKGAQSITSFFGKK